MATKDYVYLALIALSAVVFYLHGYFAGASRRRARRRAEVHGSSVHFPEPVVFTVTVEELSETQPTRGNRLREPETHPGIQCVFGHN